MKDQKPAFSGKRGHRTAPWKIAVCAVLTVLVGLGIFALIYTGVIKIGSVGTTPPPQYQPTDNPQSDPGTDDGRESALPPALAADRVEGVYSFLVVGLDHPKSSRNTDVLMLCKLDTNQGEVSVLQLPRDIYVDDPLMEGAGKLRYDPADPSTSKRICKLNNVFNLAYSAKRAQSPDASDEELFNYAINYLKNKVSSILAVPVDFHVAFNTKEYRNLLDIICPITVDVPFDMDYDDPSQDLSIHLKAGLQELDAEQAEGFSRFRQNNASVGGELAEGDFTRVNLQKIVLTAIAQKFFSSTSLPQAHAFVSSVWQSIHTDLTLGNCTWLLEKALTLYSEGTMNFSTIRLYDLPCYIPSTKTCQSLGYTQDYGFMEKDLGYTVTILNRAFNVYGQSEITADLLNYTPPIPVDYCDHSDTEGYSLQELIDGSKNLNLDLS